MSIHYLPETTEEWEAEYLFDQYCENFLDKTNRSGERQFRCDPGVAFLDKRLSKKAYFPA